MIMITFDNSLPEYAAPCERPVIQAAVDMFLEDDNAVSVWDGEELSVQGCRDKAYILKNLSQTGEDTVEVYNKDGDIRGWFYLIYNNGSENEPMIVISDYSSNEWSERVYRRLDERFGE